jgi:spore germination protein YaaH
MSRPVAVRLLGAGIAALLIAMAIPTYTLAVSLQAFVLAGAPDSLTDLEAHAGEVGVVYPTLYECEQRTGAIVIEGTGAPAGADAGTETGTGTGTGVEIGAQTRAGADAITAYARAHDIAVLPRFSCQDGATVHTILTEPRARGRMLAGLVEIAATPAYTGMNLDLENDAVPADRDALTAFVTALAHELHAHGKKLAVDVDGVTHEDPARATGLYDDRALAAAADYVFVMAWGTHWEGSSPGPIAPSPYVAAVARFLASLPHGDRFVLGAPMYGLDWPVQERSSSPRRPPATAIQYANVQVLLATTGAKPMLDRSVDELTFAYQRAGVEHRVWYLDAQAIAARLAIARAHGLGAGLWRLGEEDQALWSSPPVIQGLT